MSSRRVTPALLLACILVPLAAQGAHPLITEDTGTQGHGRSQLELTVERSHEHEDGVRENTVAPQAALSYGLTDNVDAILVIPYRRLTTRQDDTSTGAGGFGDIGLDIKWRFFERDGLSLGLKPGATLPTGDHGNGLGTGKTTYSLHFVATHDLPPWAFHLHAGGVRNRNVTDERESLRHFSVAAARSFDKRLKLVADVGTSTNPDRAARSDPAFLILGLIYSVSNAFDVDVGAKFGLTGPEADYSLLGGIALRW